MLRCESCGYVNDIDAHYCEKCGVHLRQKSSNKTFTDRSSDKKGMNKSTIALIIVCVVLLLALGVTAGALMNKGTSSSNTPVSVSQSPEQVTKADWHQVTSFSGVGDDICSFSIKGQRFKIVMTAKPTMNYGTNDFSLAVSNSGGMIGSAELNWGPKDAVSSKEKIVEFTGPSGTYSTDVLTKDLESWTVTIYDYY